MKRILVLTALCLMVPALAFAQSANPAAVGATPLSANFDVWPEMVCIDEGFGNTDLDAIGVDPVTLREEFVAYGRGHECGQKKVVISKNGVEIPSSDAMLDDNGNTFMTAACINPDYYTQVGGFGWRVSCDGDPVTGDFITSIIFFNNDMNVDFGVPVQAFNYCASSVGPNLVNDHYLGQRFNRNGGRISNVTAGRNVPSLASHTLDPYYPADNHGSRAPGCAILSNGNSLHAINDRSQGDGVKGAAEWYIDNGKVPKLVSGNRRVNVHTITNPAATTFVVDTTPTFVHPQTGATIENGNAQQVAAGNGWFAMRVDSNGGQIAFFKNDGTRIAQIFGYQAMLVDDARNLTPNLDDNIVINGANAVSASKDTLFVAARIQTNGLDPAHPCVCRFKLNAALTSVSLLPVIVVDNDLTSPINESVHEANIDVAANDEGDFVVGWRKKTNDGGNVVLRVYNDDGTPETGSFYASSLADPSTDVAYNYSSGEDDNNIKVAFNKNTICAAWLTENGVTSVNANDCSGIPKNFEGTEMFVSTAARLFSVDVATTSVDNWDLY